MQLNSRPFKRITPHKSAMGGHEPRNIEISYSILAVIIFFPYCPDRGDGMEPFLDLS